MRLLARQFIRLDRIGSALHLYQEMIQKDSLDEIAYYQAGILLKLLKKGKEAVLLLRRSEHHFGTYVPWRIVSLEGELYYLEENLALANSYLKNSIIPGRNDPYTNYYYGLCLGEYGIQSDSEAKKYLYKTIELGGVIDSTTEKKYALIKR